MLLTATSFPPASAAGPTGLRPSHLAEMLRDGDEDGGRRLLLALDRFVCSALKGDLPEHFTHFLCSARLFPLKEEERQS